MTEYQILNMMHVGFIQNAMYFVGYGFNDMASI